MQNHEKIQVDAQKRLSMNERLMSELVYDEENKEWVTWEYLDKVRQLRKKHKTYYDKSKAIERSYENSLDRIKKRRDDA